MDQRIGIPFGILERIVRRTLKTARGPRHISVALAGAILLALALEGPGISAASAGAVPVGTGGEVSVPLPPGVTRGDIRAGRERKEIDSAVQARMRVAATGRLDRTVVLTDQRGPIRLDLDRARAMAGGRAASAATANEMTFTFDSPDAPWSEVELAALRQVIDEAYPVVKAVAGPPLFAITVNVRKMPTSSYVGYYDSSRNEIVLRGVPSTDVVVHEMVHAFRDDLIMSASTFEEGMARAAEVEVMGRLPDPGPYSGLHHSYSYDVYYEALSDPRIGGRGGSFFLGEDALGLMRYQLAGYAWAKPLIEDRRFLARFNALLYRRSLADPSVRFTESKLVSIGARVRSRVEGRAFADWYARQGILDQTPPAGDFLFNRGGNVQTGLIVDDFSRDANGFEYPHAGMTVTWTATDFAHNVFGSGSDVTSPLGWIGFQPLPPPGYAGRVEITATTSAPGGGTVQDTTLRPLLGMGLFGTVSRDVPGTITITGAGGQGAQARVTDGAFSLPSLATARGTFRVTVILDDGTRLTRVFTKDASDYYLPIG